LERSGVTAAPTNRYNSRRRHAYQLLKIMTDDRHEPTPDAGHRAVETVSPLAVEPCAELQLAAAIIDVGRDLARSVPAPRGAPYFHLDSRIGYDPSVLDAFYAQGIFRKYEFALDIGSGFGGRARWLAARSGCRVLGVDAHTATVAAAIKLNRRARMDDQVKFQVGRVDCLPIRERVFTHVWMVDLPFAAVSAQVLGEAFRVLRRGGQLAMHMAGRLPVAALTGGLKAAGFVEIKTSEVRLSELPQAYRLAGDRLRRYLRRSAREAPAWNNSSTGAGATAALQAFARRPA
jgi:ubiquinone/menaquinone biosynthesis C-methylase UbiE